MKTSFSPLALPPLPPPQPLPRARLPQPLASSRLRPSVIAVGGGPLRKLAWVFGFGFGR